jgi:hypothetical protein
MYLIQSHCCSSGSERRAGGAVFHIEQYVNLSLHGHMRVIPIRCQGQPNIVLPRLNAAEKHPRPQLERADEIIAQLVVVPDGNDHRFEASGVHYPHIDHGKIPVPHKHSAAQNAWPAVAADSLQLQLSGL